MTEKIAPAERIDHMQGAIFDLDGTLLDSMPYWEGIGENYLEARGKTPAADIRRHFKRMTLAESAVYMKETYGLSESLDEISEGIISQIRDDYFHIIPLKEGVKEALELMHERGIKMCVATASERDCVVAALERLGVMPLLSAVFTCTEIGASKTQPDIFEVALEHLGTPRSETFVFEDTLHAMETAASVGFPVVAAHEAHAAADLDTIQELCTTYLDSFSQLLPA